MKRFSDANTQSANQELQKLVFDEIASKVALERLKKLELVEKLKMQGCAETVRLEVINCSRATYYRWLNAIEVMNYEA